ASRHEYVFEKWQLTKHRLHDGQQLSRDEERARAGIAQDVCVLLRRQQRVEAYRHDAGLDGAPERYREISGVEQQKGDAGLALHTIGGSEVCHPVAAGLQLAVGQGLVGIDERRLGGAALRDVAVHHVDRGVVDARIIHCSSPGPYDGGLLTFDGPSLRHACTARRGIRLHHRLHRLHHSATGECSSIVRLDRAIGRPGLQPGRPAMFMAMYYHASGCRGSRVGGRQGVGVGGAVMPAPGKDFPYAASATPAARPTIACMMALSWKSLGVKTAATPSRFRVAASSGGMMPPTATGTSSRPSSRRRRIASPASGTGLPEGMEGPTTCTDSSAAARTICAGVSLMPS